MKTILLSGLLIFILHLSINGSDKNKLSKNHGNKNASGNFTAIELKTFSNVFITLGENTGKRIETDNNKPSNIQFEIKNNKIIIFSDDNIDQQNPASVFINLKTLTKVELSGSGNIKMNGHIKCNAIELCLSGSGNIYADVETKKVNINLSGSGNINATGQTEKLTITNTGSGNINCQELKSSTGSINISGSGTNIVDVEDELIVKITGSGNVYFVSVPDRIYAKSSGTGRIERIKA